MTSARLKTNAHAFAHALPYCSQNPFAMTFGHATFGFNLILLWLRSSKSSSFRSFQSSSLRTRSNVSTSWRHIHRGNIWIRITIGFCFHRAICQVSIELFDTTPIANIRVVSDGGIGGFVFRRGRNREASNETRIVTGLYVQRKEKLHLDLLHMIERPPNSTRR